jgi:hypothetical protein
MSFSKEEILSKIKKIKNHEESAREIGNIEEAEAFATMLNRLLIKYRLSMSEVEFEEHRKEDPITTQTLEWEEFGGKNQKKRCAWVEDLASFVCKAYACKMLVYHKSNKLCIVGHETNRQTCIYTIVVLRNAAEKIADREYRKFYYLAKLRKKIHEAKGFRSSFLAGFVTRIGQRLREEVETRHTKNSTEEVGLIRLNTEASDVKKWMQNNLRVGSVNAISGHSAGNSTGYQNGVNAANRLNFSKGGIKSGSRTRGNLD